jgi:hypothetical protein
VGGARWEARGGRREVRFYSETYVHVNLRKPVQSHDERRRYYSKLLFRPGLRVQLRADDIQVRGA